MNCCVKCFKSKYLISTITLENKSGNCDFCGTKDIFIKDATELEFFFTSLIQIYNVDQTSSLNIVESLEKDFPNKIFTSTINQNLRLELLKTILKDSYEQYQDNLENNVSMSPFRDENVIKNLIGNWIDFKKEIRNVNRFHFESKFDLKVLKDFFEFFKKDIEKGSKFFRARICKDSIGFDKNNMGSPPNDKTTNGRANPQGISYLYLAKEIKTALMEVRCSLFDIATIGTFKALESLQILNLSKETYDLIFLSENENIELFIKYEEFLNVLEKDLSKPRRSFDSELDYLSTQYISEYIKSIGYDGIEYGSSLNKEGTNIAIFYPEKFKCIEVNNYDIYSMNMYFRQIPSK